MANCSSSTKFGVKTARKTADADVPEFLRLQDVNLRGIFFVVRAACAIMRSQEPIPNFADSLKRGHARGSIVTVGSVLSFGASPYLTQYTTSKHAVLGLTKTAGKHYLPPTPVLR